MRQLDSRALGCFAAASDTGEVTMHSVLDGGICSSLPAHSAVYLCSPIACKINLYAPRPASHPLRVGLGNSEHH